MLGLVVQGALFHEALLAQHELGRRDEEERQAGPRVVPQVRAERALIPGTVGGLLLLWSFLVVAELRGPCGRVQVERPQPGE